MKTNTILSKHFTLDEMIVTQQKIVNVPESQEVINSLKLVCERILEVVRAHYGLPIIVHSGYRSPAVNASVGGSDKSQHCKGEAVDFHVQHVSVYDVALWMANNMNFDQLILENYVSGVKSSGWVHCSIATSRVNRRDVRTKFKGDKKYYAGILLSPS